MALKPTLEEKTGVSVFGMTDIVFLLLIFFLLTSNFASPTGIQVEVPASSSSEKVVAQIHITVDRFQNFYINNTRIAVDVFEKELETAIKSQKAKKVVASIAIDKSVEYQYAVKVIGAAKKYGASVTLAVEANE